MAKRILSDADRNTVRELREQGFTNNALAAQFGVSVQTIIRICRPDLYEKNLQSNKAYRANNSQQVYRTRKANTKAYRIMFHRTKDASIIEHLDKQESVPEYLRKLISKDMGER